MAGEYRDQDGAVGGYRLQDGFEGAMMSVEHVLLCQEKESGKKVVTDTETLQPEMRHDDEAAVVVAIDGQLRSLSLSDDKLLSTATKVDASGGKHCISSSCSTHVSKGNHTLAKVGLILDLHYVEVTGKQNAMATSWNPVDLVECIEKYIAESTGNKNVITTELLAMDAEVNTGTSKRGKLQLHNSLKKAHFQLITSPSKGYSHTKYRGQRERLTHSGGQNLEHAYHNRNKVALHTQQGATDVDIVTALFRLAGAFAECPIVQHIVLVGGDADFLPALKAVHAVQNARFGLRLWVCAHEKWSMSTTYRAAIAEMSGVEIIPLSAIFKGVTDKAGINTIDFRYSVLPSSKDLAGEIKRQFALSTTSFVVLHLSHHQKRNKKFSKRRQPKLDSGLGHDEKYNQHDKCDTSAVQVNKMQQKQTYAITSTYFIELFDIHLAKLWLRHPSYPTRLQQIWLHHTSVDDRIGGTLANLVKICQGNLRQIHLSNTRMTKAGIAMVCKAAQSVGYGQPKVNRTKKNEQNVTTELGGGSDGRVVWKLYFNAKGLLARGSLRKYHHYCSIKY